MWFRWLYVATPQQFTLLSIMRFRSKYTFILFYCFYYIHRRGCRLTVSATCSVTHEETSEGGPWGTGCTGRGCSAASHCQYQLLVFGTSAIHHHLNLALNAGQYFRVQCCLSCNEIVVNIYDISYSTVVTNPSILNSWVGLLGTWLPKLQIANPQVCGLK